MSCAGAALQWDKMRKAGAHSHLSRWYDFMNQLAPLAVVLDKHRPKRLTAPEYFKARAEAGKGGGGEQLCLQQLPCTANMCCLMCLTKALYGCCLHWVPWAAVAELPAKRCLHNAAGCFLLTSWQPCVRLHAISSRCLPYFRC